MLDFGAALSHRTFGWPYAGFLFRSAAQAVLGTGRTSATDLFRRYLARIDAYDGAGPGLNAVREVNPDALAIAVELDAKKPATRRPLEGIPILIKDNIATADRQYTTAGDTLVPFIVAIICKITGRYHVRCRMGEFGRRYSAAGQRGQTLWPGRETWPCPVPNGRTTF